MATYTLYRNARPRQGEPEWSVEPGPFSTAYPPQDFDSDEEARRFLHYLNTEGTR